MHAAQDKCQRVAAASRVCAVNSPKDLVTCEWLVVDVHISSKQSDRVVLHLLGYFYWLFDSF
jgi:hypothetical protein